MSEHNDEPLLMDMLDACRAVTTYVKGLQLEDFLKNKLVQDAVAYRLQIIGEAAYKVSPETKTLETTIDWFKITGLRHRIVHDYRNIDLERSGASPRNMFHRWLSAWKASLRTSVGTRRSLLLRTSCCYA